MEELTAVVLANRGAPIPLMVLDAKDEPTFGPDGSVRVEWHSLRFTSNHIAQIEDRYDERESDGTLIPVGVVLMKRLQEKPTREIRWLFALVLGEPEEWVGLRMQPGKNDEYAVAISVAYSIAMGTDPKVALTIWKEGMRDAKRASDAQRDMLADVLAAIESRGTTGSEHGRGSVVPLMNSGT